MYLGFDLLLLPIMYPSVHQCVFPPGSTDFFALMVEIWPQIRFKFSLLILSFHLNTALPEH